MTADRFMVGELSAEPSGDAVLLMVDTAEYLIRIHLTPDDAERGGWSLLEAALAAREASLK